MLRGLCVLGCDLSLGWKRCGFWSAGGWFMGGCDFLEWIYEGMRTPPAAGAQRGRHGMGIWKALRDKTQAGFPCHWMKILKRRETTE